MKEIINNSSNKNIDNDLDEINFQPILYTILRNKILIFLFTLISTSLTIIYSYSIKPIYRGSFEIVVADSKSEATENKNELITLLGTGGIASSTATQELILKSPSVLMPVFDYVKSEYKRKGLDTSNMDYKSWFNREVKINFKDRTQVLSVAYLNNDKDLIIKTLNKISKKYQDFSKSVIERQINQGISYLEKQEEINKEKLVLAYQKLNKFSIENGIGTDGGYVTLNQIDVNPNKKSKLDKDSNYNSRFKTQFMYLEKYESE